MENDFSNLQSQKGCILGQVLIFRKTKFAAAVLSAWGISDRSTNEATIEVIWAVWDPFANEDQSQKEKKQNHFILKTMIGIQKVCTRIK